MSNCKVVIVGEFSFTQCSAKICSVALQNAMICCILLKGERKPHHLITTVSLQATKIKYGKSITAMLCLLLLCSLLINQCLSTKLFHPPPVAVRPIIIQTKTVQRCILCASMQFTYTKKKSLSMLFITYYVVQNTPHYVL